MALLPRALGAVHLQPEAGTNVSEGQTKGLFFHGGERHACRYFRTYAYIYICIYIYMEIRYLIYEEYIFGILHLFGQSRVLACGVGASGPVDPQIP